MQRTATAIAASLFLLLPASAASANVSSCTFDQPPAPSPRLVRPVVDGLTVNVLLPSDYQSSGLRYPVLYLLHGGYYNENTWLQQSDVARFTAPFTGGRAAIVVMPDGGPMSFYTDWKDGTQLWESYHLRRLLPYIDTHFRTIADREHRAVAGFSLGGLGALEYAARHPDLFAVTGSFSGLTHLTFPETPYWGAPAANPRFDAGSPQPPQDDAPVPAYHPPDDEGSGCNGSSNYGDRVQDRIEWHNHNPTDLAVNLRGLGVYVASGNGVPCGPQDAGGEPALFPFVEPAVLLMAKVFDRALDHAFVAHRNDFYGCGLHTMLYAQRDLHVFWPFMLASFGRAAPAQFDYRTADRDFSVWGWSFRADPGRAREFLEVRRASSSGFTLIGSGTETVVSPDLYAPGQHVEVTGAKPALATADSHGRIRLAVDLGPAHTTDQFKLLARKPTFVTRVVTLTAR